MHLLGGVIVFTVGFKYENGDMVTDVDIVDDPEKQRSLMALQVYNTIALTIDEEKRGYRIMSINRRLNTPAASGQSEANMHIEFFLRELTDKH
jgi:hypothetical protein